MLPNVGKFLLKASNWNFRVLRLAPNSVNQRYADCSRMMETKDGLAKDWVLWEHEAAKLFPGKVLLSRLRSLLFSRRCFWFVPNISRNFAWSSTKSN